MSQFNCVVLDEIEEPLPEPPALPVPMSFARAASQGARPNRPPVWMGRNSSNPMCQEPICQEPICMHRNASHQALQPPPGFLPPPEDIITTLPPIAVPTTEDIPGWIDATQQAITTLPPIAAPTRLSESIMTGVPFELSVPGDEEIILNAMFESPPMQLDFDPCTGEIAATQPPLVDMRRPYTNMHLDQGVNYPPR